MSYDPIPDDYSTWMNRDYNDNKYKIQESGQIFTLELDEVSGTKNSAAQHEITNTGTLIINGEFSEVD